MASFLSVQHPPRLLFTYSDMWSSELAEDAEESLLHEDPVQQKVLLGTVINTMQWTTQKEMWNKGLHLALKTRDCLVIGTLMVGISSH